MLAILILLVAFAYGKENFQVDNIGVTVSEALERCFVQGKCTLETGCCNGHGVCKVNGTADAECVCGKPQDCRSGLSSPSYPSYTGATCDTAAIDSGCCKDGSDDYLFAASGVCNKRDGTDPESGSKGRLLKRIGSAWYDDDLGTNHDDSSAILDMAAVLMNTSRGVHSTKFNMMSLGFLEVAIRDIVHYNYYDVADNNFTVNGTTYPSIKHQNNTGIQAGNQTIPKQHENMATGIIDLGPLYDYATHISGGPYINYTAAADYWTKLHKSNHFVLSINFYGLWHNYVARNIEEYFCGANSLSSPMENTCTVSITEQYELARRSTIRFSQSLLQQAILFFVMENGDALGGFTEPTFEQWFRRDTTLANGIFLDGPFTKVRDHQEWLNDVVRTDLSHHSISGLDWGLSLRNKDINTSAWGIFASSSPCGITPNSIAQDVINHFHTKTHRFGDQIDPVYRPDLESTLTYANQLGLASYKNHVDLGLTDDPSVSDILTHQNVFYGAHLETNSDRQYASTSASVWVASIVEISDAIMADRTGYFAADEYGVWLGSSFHPNDADIQAPSYGFVNCYKGEGEDCTSEAKNAAGVLTGQIRTDIGFSTQLNVWQSRGSLFAQPMDYEPVSNQDGYEDPLGRQMSQYQIIPEVLNPLFYQFDGASTMGFKGADQDTYFLPNVITDSIPTSIAWNSNLDGLCFSPTFVAYPYSCSISSPTGRSDTSSVGGECVWTFE